MTRVLSSLALGAALSSLAVAQSDVWIVDAAGGPGADFTTLGTAFAGAADGDTLLFRTGAYPSPIFPLLTLDGKGLTMIAEGPASLGYFEVKNLAASQSFTARGFHGASGGLNITQCGGPVWLEDLAIDPDSTDPQKYWDVYLWDCPTVAMTRCDLVGLPALTLFNAPAVALISSGLHVFDSVLTGGAGFSHPPTLTPGQPGITVNSSFLFASGTTFQGGILASESATQVGASSESIVLDCVGDVTVDEGEHTVWPSSKRSFEATAVAREGEAVTMTWNGAPGELAILNLSTSPGGFFFPQFNGSGILGLPLLLIDDVGVVPGSGEVSIQVPIPELGAGVEGLVFYAQGSFAELTSGTIRLGGGSAILLLDQSL